MFKSFTMDKIRREFIMDKNVMEFLIREYKRLHKGDK